MENLVKKIGVIVFVLVSFSVLGCSGSDESGEKKLSGSWIRVVEHAEFSPRDTAKGFEFLGKMWISNGYGSDGLCDRDLWSSEDGIRWTKILDETPYDPYSAIVVYNGKLWAISQSVWSSENGVDWVRIIDSTPFGAWWAGKAVVHDGKMWYLGHGAGVWWSIDGVTWYCATTNAPYGVRAAPAVTVFNRRLWVIGGSTSSDEASLLKTYRKPVMNNDVWSSDLENYPSLVMHNDVWSSTDGTNWKLMTQYAPWKGRMWFVAETYADRLWVMGGFDNNDYVNFADAWYTFDGVDWKQFNSESWWTARHEPAICTFNNSLWIIAGNSWPLMNDVWRLTATWVDH